MINLKRYLFMNWNYDKNITINDDLGWLASNSSSADIIGSMNGARNIQLNTYVCVTFTIDVLGTVYGYVLLFLFIPMTQYL